METCNLRKVPRVIRGDNLCPGHDNKLLDFQIHTKTCNIKELKKMSKLGTLARVAVGIVVIGTLWPIGLFGDD